MELTPFHAMVIARTLSGFTHGRDRLIAALSASDIKVYPYQVAAAMFALRSPYLKGAVLCDEGSLGKTMEAMLIITQLWYEGKTGILVVVTTPLLHQWELVMGSRFSVPFCRMDNAEAFDAALAGGCENPFRQDAVILTTYEFAAERAPYLSRARWDLAVFEEAHHLWNFYNGENKSAAAIRQAVGGAFKLLLTATPMPKYILNLYGLISFIDERVFPDEKAFYARYFRRPEHYGELAERVIKYCFRTLRSQVVNYVKIPKRIPVVIEYEPTPQEQEVSRLLEAYIRKGSWAAFPKMDQYDLALLLFRTFSSSSFALERTLSGILRRMEAASGAGPEYAAELAELRILHEKTARIRTNAKGRELLNALKQGLAALKRLGARRKALIFTENRATQTYLFRLLTQNGYNGKVLTYHGGNSRDYTILEGFAEDAELLIATDIAAEGLNLEFCSFVVNYDLPNNSLAVEQRANRCHRQDQENEVLFLSFLNRSSFADVRTLELVNKRVLQFSGVFGMSDAMLGNFGVDFSSVLASARSRDEIERAYQDTLREYEDENKRLVEQTEQSLFTSFDRTIAESVTITPQYARDKTEEINRGLWALTRYFFDGRQGYTCIDETRTLLIDFHAEKVFTGAHLGRRAYSIDDKSLPKSGRHTLSGALAKNMFAELFWRGVPEYGSIAVDGDVESCAIGFYTVRVKKRNAVWGGGFTDCCFAGRTKTGRVLSDEECRGIMELPVRSFQKSGDTRGQRDGMKKPTPDALDALVQPEAFIRRAITETEPAEQEELSRLRLEANGKKAELERRLEHLRSTVETAETELENARTRLDKLVVQKRLTQLKRDLMRGEENLFLDSLRLDAEREEQEKALLDASSWTAEVERQFIVQVTGTVK